MNPFDKLLYVWHHPSNKGKRFRAVRRSFLWQIHKRLIGGYQDISIVESRILRCYSHIDCTPLIVYAGLYDFHEMNFLLRYLRSDDNFLDVGGNVGIYAILASSIVTSGKIHVFEPSEISRNLLNENIILNNLKNIQVYPFAVGNTRGMVKFTCNMESMNHIAIKDLENNCETVEQVTLDDTVGFTNFSLGKVDVEGAEMLVFKGGENMLETHNPPVWIFELGDASVNFGYTRKELINYIRQFNFRLVSYNANNNKIIWNDDIWRHSSSVIVISEGKKDEIEMRLNS